MNEIHDYHDMYGLSRPKSKHKKMDRLSRAAQFSPFAALSGYEDALKEKERTFLEKREISEEEKEKINLILLRIQKEIHQKSLPVDILYFKKDEVKEGGEEIHKKTDVIRIDEEGGFLLLKDSSKVCFEDIYSLKISSYSSRN